jgi:hypothetical protein
LGAGRAVVVVRCHTSAVAVEARVTEPGRDRGAPDWPSVLRGATAGLAVLVPVTIIRVVLERAVTDFDHNTWIYPLSVLVLLAYGLAGAVAARGATRAPRWTGALAGFASVVGWIPIRVVIWGFRDTGRALFVGAHPVLPPGQLTGALVLGLVGGWVGGLLGARGRKGARSTGLLEQEPAAQRGA